MKILRKREVRDRTGLSEPTIEFVEVHNYLTAA